MTRHFGRFLVLAVAILLLGGCASCPRCVPSEPMKAEKFPRNWTSRETDLGAFWWRETVGLPKDPKDPTAPKDLGTGAGAVVAIVGTGVLKGHEDLPTMAPGKATCGSKPDDTNDSFNGHGTQLAGIVAGREDGHATRGVAPAARLIPIKVDCGLVLPDTLTSGVDAAIASKPDIILIAIGGYPYGPSDFSSFMLGRVNSNPGILFVVASVWDGSAEYAFPKWTQAPNALLVAAMTLDADPGRPTIVSTREVPYTARRGTIWAPGRMVETADIELEPGSTTTHSKFYMHGTSPAAAIVAGCAALVKSKSGTTGAALKSALLAGAPATSDLGPSPNGRLNCAKVPSR